MLTKPFTVCHWLDNQAKKINSTTKHKSHLNLFITKHITAYGTSVTLVISTTTQSEENTKTQIIVFFQCIFPHPQWRNWFVIMKIPCDDYDDDDDDDLLMKSNVKFKC